MSDDINDELSDDATSDTGGIPEVKPPTDIVPGEVKAGAVAAIVGGAVWVAKGGLVLAGRDSFAGIDLGILFVVVQGLFAVAVIGVEELLGERADRRAEIGTWFASGAIVLSLVNLGIWVFAGTAAVPGWTAALASLGWVVGAVLVGITAMRAEVLPRPWHSGLMALGWAALLLLIPFGWARNILDMPWLLEVPVIVLGAAWVAFGVELWSAGWRARWAVRDAR